jgi:hypothetical protein
VAGYSNSNDGDVSGNHTYTYTNTYEYSERTTDDYWVVKLSSSGDIKWQKSLGGSGSDEANSIQQTSDGGYIVAGYSNSNDGDVSGNHTFDEYTTYDYWVVKLNSSGGIEWQKSLGGSGSDGARSIRQTSDGGYIVAGSSNSNNGNVSGNHTYTYTNTYEYYERTTNSFDYWVVKLASLNGGGKQPTFDTWPVLQKDMVWNETVISILKNDIDVGQAKEAKPFESADLQKAIDDGTISRDIGEFLSAESGVVTANKDALLDGLESAVSGDEKISVNEEKIIPLPIVTAKVPSGKKTAIVTFRLNMDELEESPFGDVLVIKQKNDAEHTSEILARVEGNDPAAITSGRFVFTDRYGTAIPTDYKVKAKEVYYLNVGIGDNTDYDWDETSGQILDPMALSEKSTGTGKSSSSGGGCSAGLGVPVLLVLALAVCVRGRKEQ